MTVKGYIKQYRSGFKSKVRLPNHGIIEMKWFRSANAARMVTERFVWRQFGGAVIDWQPGVARAGGMR